MSALNKLLEVRHDGNTVELVTLRPDGRTSYTSFGLKGHYQWGQTLLWLTYAHGAGEVEFMLAAETGASYTFVVRVDDLQEHVKVLRSIKPYALLTAIRYGDDHITVDYDDSRGKAQSVTFGMFEGYFRYTLSSYATNFLLSPSLADIYYLMIAFEGEDGRAYCLPLTCPVEDMRQHCLDLNAYIRSFDIPKVIAAPVSSVWPAAA